MSKRQKITLFRILASVAVCVFPMVLPLGDPLRLAVFLAAYLLVGGDVLWEALTGILHGQIFDENFLMALATVGAFLLGDYLEAMAVMVFYQVGELFQSYAVGKSRKSIAQLMDIRPDYAVLLREGQELRVDPEEVQVGDSIIVRPGERIPLDGVILAGHSSMDTSALTGESLPRDAVPGQEVISGCINLTGILTIEVTKEFGESTVAKILDLVENASSKKANVENFITKFARYYTPTVVIAAVLLALSLPLLIPGMALGESVRRALSFLVVSCPCALVISIPLSFFGGIGGASKCGVLIKGSNYMEALARAEAVVFDKTGTLTKGAFAVTGVYPAPGIEQKTLLELAAHGENYSNHPISRSILAAYGKAVDQDRIGSVEEVPGKGLIATVDGHRLYAGNDKLMELAGVAYSSPDAVGTVVHLAHEGRYLGCIAIADQIKEDAKYAVSALRAAGVRKTVMLTGDADAIGRKVAGDLGLDEVYTQLLPADKVERMESILSSASEKGTVVFVGDGINDAPVLARADVGIAMGGLGSDAAIEAADVVIMTDEPSQVATAIKISKKTLAIAWQNIVFALGVKVVVLILSAIGMASMWAAVFADVGVSVIAILNAIRALSVKNL
ncbi:cadmium-translocating P-type ATPase [Christensenella sp. MSJ-20]|uniref:heavy metal translocating P-type ATPase n=1 Tax=Christensenella sp. MSJ-20 TaxID=2841518 RepID=UPI001C77473A|nr:cadmium-translocating P-type ATPase [Christensenella sp. MSJ-20]